MSADPVRFNDYSTHSALPLEGGLVRPLEGEDNLEGRPPEERGELPSQEEPRCPVSAPMKSTCGRGEEGSGGRDDHPSFRTPGLNISPQPSEGGSSQRECSTCDEIPLHGAGVTASVRAERFEAAGFRQEVASWRARLSRKGRRLVYPLSMETSPSQRAGRWPPEWSAAWLAAGRFLVHIFDRLRARWGRGGLSPFPRVWRPSIKSRCGYGTNLAPAAEFEDQAARARQVFDWDRSQAHLLKRLESGRTPLVLDLFCCAGGVSEGFRRAGGCSLGVDANDQPSFVARFGAKWFHLGNALDRQVLRGLVRRLKPIAIWASPPCEASSTVTFGGGHNSSAPRLISQTRDLLRELGLPYIIENVQGASSELSSEAITLRGQDFGLETERPRLFEAGNGLEIRPSSFLTEGVRPSDIAAVWGLGPDMPSLIVSGGVCRCLVAKETYSRLWVVHQVIAQQLRMLGLWAWMSVICHSIEWPRQSRQHMRHTYSALWCDMH